jgi:streptogramin lyase
MKESGMKRYTLAIVLGTLVTSVVAMSMVRPVSAQPSASGEAGAPGLMGLIRGGDRKPMNGVAVTAQAYDQTFKTTVFADDQGEYVFPHLAAGAYRVWAQAVGYVTDRGEVKLDGAHTASHEFTLKPLANFEAQLTGAEWLAALPEDSVEHRRMKQVLYVGCSGCHGLDVVMNNKFDQAGWTAVVKSMESADYRGYRGADDISVPQLGWEGQIIRHHRDDLAKYLTEMRGPEPSPMILKPMPRPIGDAARVVITQYDLPIGDRANEMAWYTGDDWMKGYSTGMHGMVGIHDVLADPRGYAWITQSRENFETNRSLIKLDPETGKMEMLRLTNAQGNPMYFEQVGPDAQGNIWMHGGGSFVKLNTAAATFTAYPIPRVFNGTENSIDPDSKGRVWANGKYGVVELDTTELDKKGVMYPGWHLYQQTTPGNGTTYGISADADDNPWWSVSYSDIVATKDMKTGKVTEFVMQDPEYDARKALFAPDLEFYDSIGAEQWAGTSGNPLPYGEMPRRLAADKNGDTVWVPNWAQSNVAEINIHTMKVTYHELPMKIHPYKTIVDKNHNVYTDTQVGDGVYKFAPSTQEWTYYQLPTHGCSSRHMSFDDVRGEAWVPCDQADTVDRIQFRSPEQIQALKAAAVK